MAQLVIVDVIFIGVAQRDPEKVSQSLAATPAAVASRRNPRRRGEPPQPPPPWRAAATPAGRPIADRWAGPELTLARQPNIPPDHGGVQATCR
jgi:hypothetical protein